MEEELIEAVRREKCLYDVTHPDYMRVKLKESIWTRIAGLNVKDGNAAKRAWEKLRNNHRDALRRQKNVKTKSASGAVNIKHWRFQENMAFLIPHMANRVTNTKAQEETHSDELAQTYSDSNENDIKESAMDKEDSRIGNEEINQSLEPSPDLSTDQVHKRRRRKLTTFNDSLNRFIERHHQRANRRRGKKRLMTDTTNDFTVNDV